MPTSMEVLSRWKHVGEPGKPKVPLLLWWGIGAISEDAAVM